MYTVVSCTGFKQLRKEWGVATLAWREFRDVEFSFVDIVIVLFQSALALDVAMQHTHAIRLTLAPIPTIDASIHTVCHLSSPHHIDLH